MTHVCSNVCLIRIGDDLMCKHTGAMVYDVDEAYDRGIIEVVR